MTGERTETGKIVLGWWRKSLRPGEEMETGEVRGFRARLRRAQGPLQVLAEPRSVALYDELTTARGRRLDPIKFAALAHLLASVKQHESRRIARAFGMGETPALSPLRFQHLIRIEAPEPLGEALRRALPLIGHSCNVAALADDFLYWNEQIRAGWCFDYFGKASPEMPVAVPETEETE